MTKRMTITLAAALGALMTAGPAAAATGPFFSLHNTNLSLIHI